VFITSILNVTPSTTVQHLIVRTGKSDHSNTVILIIKDCAQGIVLLKLTTDRHEDHVASLRQQSYLFQ